VTQSVDDPFPILLPVVESPITLYHSLSPIPQHTVSLCTSIYQETSWSGPSGLVISRTQRNILRYSSIGIVDTGIVPDTGVICHDSP
jgi:hypothetical protein